MSLFFCDADTNTEVTRFPVQIIPIHLSLHGSLPFQFDGLFFQLSVIAMRAEESRESVSAKIAEVCTRTPNKKTSHGGSPMLGQFLEMPLECS
jgi:hypothetical protein